MEPEEILTRFYSQETIPIDMVKLAENMGIRLSGVDFLKMEENILFKDEVKAKGHILGSTIVKNGNVEISFSEILNALSKDNLRKQQRFIIAHEIAYYCLYMNKKDSSHIYYDKDSEKRRANIFAEKLLMPSNLIIKIAKNLNYDLSLTFLSNLFKVPRSAVKARLKFLIECEKILPSITRIWN